MHQICIWNTGHMQSIAGPVHASAVWTDEKKKKKKKKNTELFLWDIHCLQITGQSRLLGPDSSVLTLVDSAQTEFVHNFRDNAVTGDISLISLVLESMVPLSTWYISMPGTSGIYFVRLPNRLCSSPPLLGFYWNRRGGGNDVASGLNVSREWITMDKFSGLGINSAFCPTFFL